MSFQAHEGAQGQTDMIALGQGEPELSTLYAGELLETAMVDLHLPNIQRQPSILLDGHAQVAGGPVFNVAVWVNGLEHLDPAIAFEMHQCPVRRDEDLADGPIAAAIRVPSRLLLSWVSQSQWPSRSSFQIVQPAVPAIAAHQPRRKTSPFRRVDHRENARSCAIRLALCRTAGSRRAESPAHPSRPARSD